ncbi:MAG: enolase C-terminal domain-like protein [Pirellulaceae bacterium]
MPDSHGSSPISRRRLIGSAVAASAAVSGPGGGHRPIRAGEESGGRGSNAPRITRLTVTPIALPDPPLLAASGCHGPYFLRNIVELHTDAGVVGIGETHGGEAITENLRRAAPLLVGRSVWDYHALAGELRKLSNSTYAGIELACLDAAGRAVGLSVSQLLGGKVRERVEFAAYLFYRYAADHPAVLSDPRLVDDRGTGDRALDSWGEVLNAEAMAELADRLRARLGFRVFKLKAGVLDPHVELATLRAMHARFADTCLLRIDPNGVWRVPTALRIGAALRDLPLEYYEDPVAGQTAMAEVRQATGLKMSTNMCVTRFEHIPDAVRIQPIDIVLGDHHGWGGLTAFQSLGTLTEALGWGMSQHSNNHAGITMAAMIHAGAITPQVTYPSDTHYIWLPDSADILRGGKLPIEGGTMAVPMGPGLGVELDRDKLARAHEVYRRCGMRSRDDGATMRRFAPAWERRLF